jgi:streptomycin 6-kinase
VTAAGEADPAGGALARWRADRDRLVRECAARWELVVGVPYRGPHVAFVAPARTASGTTVVLKVQFPHRECVHEAEALRRWDGAGAVRLLDTDPEHDALLLEHVVPGGSLTAGEPDAVGVLAGLLHRLWVPAAEPFTRLADEAARWHEHLGRPGHVAGLDPALVGHARRLLAELGPTGDESVLLHQDLHGGNVLRATREPWLAIDPKPLVGERAFAVAPIVRSVELGHDRDAVLHRLDRLCADLALDRDRALGWTVAQTIAWAARASPEIVARHQQVARWLLDAD